MEPAEVLAHSDVTFLTVPDDAVPTLAAALAPCVRPGAPVVHACGVVGLEVLEPLRAAGAIPMAIHPAMTFTGSSLDVGRMRGAPFAVTAPALYLPIAQALVAELGGEPFTVADDDRPAYHAALVQAANHSQVLIASARRVLGAIGVGDPEALLRPVVLAAVDGALAGGIDALTGPASRGDATTLVAHRQALERVDPEDGSLYRAVALAALDAARRAGRLDETRYVIARDALDGQDSCTPGPAGAL
jgi:predicted short-subunit dehydrogenase-like oxidoreductase (DUF2520 family)